MAYNAEFIEGFDKYGPVGLINCQGGATTLAQLLLAGEWTNSSGALFSLVSPFVLATGAALQISNSGTGNLTKTLPANYAQLIGGFTFSSNLSQTMGIAFNDAGTAQFSVCLETTGKISVREGSLSATLLAQSSVSVSSGAVHVLEYNVVFSATTGGSYNIYLDGALILTGSSAKTAYGSANNYANQIALVVGAGALGGVLTVDHLYLHMYISSGFDTPLLNNPVIETQFASSDSAVQFTPQAYTLGQNYTTTATNSAPGANELVLRAFTPPVNMTINSIGILPETSSGTANFKGVIYGDSGGAPHTLLSSGTQATGCTSGTALALPLSTPQSLTGATQYWIGYITDTSVNIAQVDNTTNTGQKASNTYTSGAPGTAPSMTAGQPSWSIWGACTSPASNYTEVNDNPPLGAGSYVSDTNVGDADLYGFPALSASATNIQTVAVKAYCERSDAGARTVDLNTKSSGTTGQGSNSGITPPSGFGWISTYFDTDPNTSAAWASAAAVNAATSGLSIAS